MTAALLRTLGAVLIALAVGSVCALGALDLHWWVPITFDHGDGGLRLAILFVMHAVGLVLGLVLAFWDVK